MCQGLSSIKHKMTVPPFSRYKIALAVNNRWRTQPLDGSISSSLGPRKPEETEVSLLIRLQMEENLGLGNHTLWGLRHKTHKATLKVTPWSKGSNNDSSYHRPGTMFSLDTQGDEHHPLFTDGETGLREAMWFSQLISDTARRKTQLNQAVTTFRIHLETHEFIKTYWLIDWLIDWFSVIYVTSEANPWIKMPLNDPIYRLGAEFTEVKQLPSQWQ